MTSAIPVTEPTQAKSAKSSPSKPQTKRVTLLELGPRLPLGVVGADGSVSKDLVCKPWRGREEREVGKLKASGKESGDFVTRLLAYMFTKVGPHDFENMKDPEKHAVISSMFMGDVLYMYVWLRVQCVDKSLKMNLTCPNCNFSFPFDADLETVEVRTADKLDAVKWSYKLKVPFDIRGKPATGFELSPTRWQTMEISIKAALDAGDVNIGGAKMDIIQGCARRIIDREEMVLTANEYDNMMKVDIERLCSRIDEHEIGPDMSVKQKCPGRCKREFVTSLDWGYESFFEDSSPS